MKKMLIAAVALAFFFRPKKLNWNRWMALYLFCYAGLCMAAILSLSMTAAPISVGMQYTALVWLFVLTPVTGVYEIVPGFICSMIVAVLVSKAAGKPSEGALAVYDAAMAEALEE